MASEKAKFSDGERILCFHGPLMYEAKSLKVEFRESGKEFYYFVHYNGWNKHWDEWVPETRVLKFTDLNRQKQKDLMRQHGKDKAKRGKPAKPNKVENGKEVTDTVKKLEPTATSEPVKKKSKTEPSVEAKEAYIAKVEVNVKIPAGLKPVLVDDWDLVTRQKHLFQLPAKVAIEDILNSYIEKNSTGSSAENVNSLQELIAGIKEYFNVMLGSQLLYKYERSQYNEILAKHPDLTMVQIYGMPHLLRFFVKVGSILSYTDLNERNMNILVSHMHKFLDYLEENISLLFSSDDYIISANRQRNSSKTNT